MAGVKREQDDSRPAFAFTRAERRALLVLALLLLGGLAALQVRALLRPEPAPVTIHGAAVQAPSPSGEADPLAASEPLDEAGVPNVPSDAREPARMAVSGDSAGGAPGAKVDINRAGRELLESLPGIGPVYATRILQWRRRNGRFNRVDDLMLIKGIGEKRLEKLRPHVTAGP